MCNKCNQDCGCKPNKCFPCADECKVRISTDCATVPVELPNIGSDADESLTTVLELIDEFLAQTPPTPEISITNVGTGQELFKGQSSLGNYEFRTISAGSGAITVEQAGDNIVLDINIPELPTRTYTASNSGTGAGIYKDSTITSSNTQFNFKGLVSDTLTITQETNSVRIEQPAMSDIPRFVVNSAYTGTEETGSLSKPFKTIQGALNAFVGTGSALNPQFAGAEIVIQKGVGYTFIGNFNYNSVSIILDEGTNVLSNPSIGNYLCDLDTMADASINLNITLKDFSTLALLKSGFKNAGTTASTSNYTLAKTINITGRGQLVQGLNNISSNLYTIFESNFTATDTFNNDSVGQIIVKDISVSSNTQSVYKVGGNSRLSLNNVSIAVYGFAGLPTSTLFFNQIGGNVSAYACSVSIMPNIEITPNIIFSISKTGIVPSNLTISNTRMQGRVGTLFHNNSALQPTVLATGIRTELFLCVSIAKSPSVLWTGCNLFDNVFTSGSLDNTQVDLTSGNTISSSNHIGGRLVEVLVRYLNRTSAQAVLPPYSAFINTKDNAINNFSLSSAWLRDITLPTA